MPPFRDLLDILPNANIGPIQEEDGQVAAPSTKRENALSELDVSLPNVRADALKLPNPTALGAVLRSSHKPRVPSLRFTAFSVVQPVSHVRQHVFLSGSKRNRHLQPERLAAAEDTADTHPKVQELRRLVNWSEGQVWCSPRTPRGHERDHEVKSTGFH